MHNGRQNLARPAPAYDRMAHSAYSIEYSLLPQSICFEKGEDRIFYRANDMSKDRVVPFSSMQHLVYSNMFIPIWLELHPVATEPAKRKVMHALLATVYPACTSSGVHPLANFGCNCSAFAVADSTRFFKWLGHTLGHTAEATLRGNACKLTRLGARLGGLFGAFE